MVNITVGPPPASAVLSTDDNGVPSFAFGRYSGPITDARMPASGWFSAYRLKEWEYLSLTTPTHFVALAVIQLGYVGQCFAYVVERGGDHRFYEYQEKSPLGRACTFAESSARGRTSWVSWNDRVEIDHSESGDVKVSISLPLWRRRAEDGGWEKKNLIGDYLFKIPDESMSLLFDLGNKTPAYTHKLAGVHASSGSLKWGEDGTTIAIDNRAMVSVDYTRSFARRETKWKWANFSGHDSHGNKIGMNLSADVYDTEDGHSMENAFFHNGKLYDLRGVKFEIPSTREGCATEQWRIIGKDSADRHSVDLTFTPAGMRHEDVNVLGIVSSKFCQPFGHFYGKITLGDTVVELDGVFGVVEDHLAVW
eukprot:Opistho-2@72983